MVTTNASAEPGACRWLWLDAQYRRACLWGMAGCVVFPLAAFVIQQWAPLPRDWTEIAMFSALGLLALGRCLLPVVRVDASGVHARWWWTWDVWTWEEFQSGSVRLGIDLGGFANERRPWWRRKLSLALLADGDRTEVCQLIERIRVTPAPGPLPEQLTVTMEWPRSERLTISREGLTIRKRQVTFDFQWAEVRSVEVWQLEHGRPDFRELLLEVGAHKLFLRQFQQHGMDCRTWKENNCEELLGTFRKYLAPDQLLMCAENSPPESMRELEHRLERLRASLRELRVLDRTLGSGMGLLAASMLVMLPWPGSLGMASFILLLTLGFHSISQFLPQSTQERIDQLEQSRPRLELVRGTEDRENSPPGDDAGMAHR